MDVWSFGQKSQLYMNLELVIFYTEILARKVDLWVFFKSEKYCQMV